jgi:hypothetical protein
MADLTGYLYSVGGGSRSCPVLGGRRWSHGTRGTPGAAPSPEVGVGAVEPRDAPGAALRQAVGAGATGTHGAPGATPSLEVGAAAEGTHGGPRAALHREVGARARETRGGLGAALSQEVGGRAVVTHGGPGATLSREEGTTPPPPLPCPFTRGQGVVVPVTPPDNPHRMVTQGKTGFRVVPDRLVLTVVTSSSTSSPIPSSARAALVDPHWRAAMEEEYGALISNGTWELVPRPLGSNIVTNKWVFTHKLCADGTLDRYKAR